jgi:hypothetical protein
MHEEALFLYAPGKNIKRLQKLDCISIPHLKATGSFPAITDLTGFDLKVNLQLMYFEFLFASSLIRIVQIELHRYPNAFSRSPCHSRGFYVIGGRAFFGRVCKIGKSDY